MSKLSPDFSSVTRVGLDLAGRRRPQVNHVFQVHAVDAAGAEIDKRPIRRAKLLDYFAALPPCTIGMEACSSSHHWARQFGIFLANGYMIFIVNASEFQPEAINTAYTARYSSAMLDHDTMGLIEGLGGW